MAVVKKKLPPASKTKAVKRSESAAKTDMKLSLPTAVSTPSDNLGDYSILLFGDKKIGKTTLASFFPNAFFLMSEPGAKSLAVYQRPVPDWKTFKGYIKLLKEDDQKEKPRFGTVVLDTVDLLFKACDAAVCYKLGISHPSEEDWGKGWGAIRDEFTGTMKDLLLLNKGLILISHSTDREVKTRSGEKYHRIQPTMSGQARDIIEGMVDIFAHYTYEETRRVLVIRGDEHVTAGHRLQNHFRHPDGSELTEIEMGPTAEAGYANFISAWSNTYRPPVRPRPDKAEPADQAAPPRPKVVKRRVA